MKHVMDLETLETRKLLSVSPTASVPKTVTVIGPTSGVTAASATPVFTTLTGSVSGKSEETSIGLDLDTSLAIHVNTNGTGSIDATHLARASVVVTDTTTNTVVSSSADVSALSKVITSGGGDVIVVSFKNLLTANHDYTIEINAVGTPSNYVVRTTDGSGSTNFADTTFTFSTGSFFSQSRLSSKFSAAVTQTNAGSKSFTALTWGPDDKLYAADTRGYIYVFTPGSDGTLGTPTVITTIRTYYGGDRLITGMAFKPNSTATAMDLWVSSGQFRFGNNPSGSDPVQKSADNFTGEIDSLSGSGLVNLQPLVINIPRSVKDHMNNQIVFSPDLHTAYFGVAAMNAMGAPDSTWGNRPENIYSATIMQLRTSGAASVYAYIRNHGPVNLLIDGGNNATGADPSTTHYNIFKGMNPLRIWADGVRNDFDMVFASNGHLYAAINGSSSGGNTPATPSDLSTVPTTYRPDKDINGLTYTGPTAPALTNVNTVEEDMLLDVTNGAYYGHPNPARGEYVLDGGNPTSGVDPYEFVGNGTNGYATGQQPDRNYTQPVYDFGLDYSPDGMIQYKAVGGKNIDLNGYLLVCRYSSGGDVLALQPKADGSIGEVQPRIDGLTGLGTPLDIIEDPNTGNLYVSVLTDETGNSSNSGAILLMKPITTTSSGTPTADISTTLLKTHPTPGDTNGQTLPVTLTNTGTGDLIVDRSSTRIAGRQRKNFIVSNLPTDDITIAPGDSFTFFVKGVLAAGSTTTAAANLQIKVNAPNATNGYVSIGLRAIPPVAGLRASSASVFSQGTPVAASKSLIGSDVVSQLSTKDVNFGSLLS